MRLLLAIFLSLILYASQAEAACTDGTDCYCDRVATGSGDPIADASLLKCYDFDAPALYLDTGNAWYVDDGDGKGRGEGSQWNIEYGQSVGTLAYLSPSGPYVGFVCDWPGGCASQYEYCSAAQGTDAGITTTGGGDDGVNCWGGSGYDANAISRIDIQKLSNLDYKAEVTDFAGPTYEASHTNYHLGMRTSSNGGGLLDQAGKQSFSTTELGITMMVAWSHNLNTSGVLNKPWKHDEIETSPSTFTNNQFPFSTTGGCQNEATTLEEIPGTMTQEFPFCPYFKSRLSNPCTSVSATVNKGTVSCASADEIRMKADTAEWDSATDLVTDEWMCVRGWVEGYHTVDTRIRVWVTTSAMTDRLIIDIDDMDTTAAGNSELPDTMVSYQLNNYSNAAATAGYEPTESTYRHQDNVHIRSGEPVSCAQVGFVAGASASASLSGGSISGGSLQ